MLGAFAKRHIVVFLIICFFFLLTCVLYWKQIREQWAICALQAAFCGGRNAAKGVKKAMQPKMCSKCKKNVAVIFISKVENGVTMNEGYCIKCARSLGIPQIDQAVK